MASPRRGVRWVSRPSVPDTMWRTDGLVQATRGSRRAGYRGDDRLRVPVGAAPSRHRWTRDWTVLVTLAGWFAALLGLLRMFAASAYQRATSSTPSVVLMALEIVLLLLMVGALLYVVTWVPLMVAPASAWSTSRVGFLARVCGGACRACGPGLHEDLRDSPMTAARHFLGISARNFAVAPPKPRGSRGSGRLLLERNLHRLDPGL